MSVEQQQQKNKKICLFSYMLRVFLGLFTNDVLAFFVYTFFKFTLYKIVVSDIFDLSTPLSWDIFCE